MEIFIKTDIIERHGSTQHMWLKEKKLNVMKNGNHNSGCIHTHFNTYTIDTHVCVYIWTNLQCKCMWHTGLNNKCYIHHAPSPKRCANIACGSFICGANFTTKDAAAMEFCVQRLNWLWCSHKLRTHLLCAASSSEICCQQWRQWQNKWSRRTVDENLSISITRILKWNILCTIWKNMIICKPFKPERR